MNPSPSWPSSPKQRKCTFARSMTTSWAPISIPAPLAVEPQRAAIVHCGAGIPAARYRRFAGFLAASGIPTLVYDYRGIGLSRPKALRGFRAAIEDWAEYDCGGALAWMRERFPDADLVGIAHSIGALLVGGAPNSAEHDRLVLVGGPHRLLRRLSPALPGTDDRGVARAHARDDPDARLLSGEPTRSGRRHPGEDCAAVGIAPLPGLTPAAGSGRATRACRRFSTAAPRCSARR